MSESGLRIEFRHGLIIIQDERTKEEVIADNEEDAKSIVSNWLYGGTPIGGVVPSYDESALTIRLTTGPRGDKIVLTAGGKRTELKTVDNAMEKITSYIYGVPL